MDMVQPTSWAEALAAKASSPDLVPIAGGTDVMVDLNFDRRRPGGLLHLTRVAELREWGVADGTVELGAGVTYAQVVADLADLLPGLAMASRTVGSPQIRNRGTVGGNLGSASPAGDAHPPRTPPTVCAVSGSHPRSPRHRRSSPRSGRRPASP